MKLIDLNADVGEGYDDEPLFPFLSSINIACGGHAGDDHTMRAAISSARRHGLAVGAHPGWEDQESFGRRPVQSSAAMVEALVARQILRLARIAHSEDTKIGHVKPHGALYNQAAKDRTLADAIVRGILSVDGSLMLVGLAGSALLDAALAVELPCAAEAFVDRAYLRDGSLAPRDLPGSVNHDPAAAAQRALSLARGEPIQTLDGTKIHIDAQTLCLHGDTPGAIDIARAVRGTLDAAGICVRPYRATR